MKTAKPQSVSYQSAIGIPWDEAVITQELMRLITLRRESFTEYEPELPEWIDHLKKSGYGTDDVIEMLDLAKDLPKYAGYRLTIGDVISNWKKETGKTRPWDWAQFGRMLNKFAKADKDLIDKLYKHYSGIGLITRDERATLERALLKIIADEDEETRKDSYLKLTQQRNDQLRQLTQENERLSELQINQLRDRITQIYNDISYDLWKTLLPLYRKYEGSDVFENEIAKFFKELKIDDYLKNG